MANSLFSGLICPLIKEAILNNYSPEEYDNVDDFVSLIQADTCEIASIIDDIVDDVLTQELVDLAIEVYTSNH